MPAPACFRFPVPLIALLTVSALLRSNTSAALLVTAPVPSVPAVPPAPTCSVPALIVVVPLYVLLRLSVCVPVPVFVSPPVPLITPLKFIVELASAWKTLSLPKVTAPVQVPDPPVPVHCR